MTFDLADREVQNKCGGDPYESCVKECEQDASTYDASTCFACIERHRSYFGTVREIFFASQIQAAGLYIRAASQGDFHVACSC